MRKDNSLIKTKFISEPGSYLHNLDYFAFMELEDYACYCIADGIDNDTQKKSAEIAVSTILEVFQESHGFSRRLMKRYLKAAHKELQRVSTDIRLETSITVVLTNYKKIIWGLAGNTRMYCLRNGKVRYQSYDQSLSQKMANEGELALDLVQTHEERHNLYCYLGIPTHFQPFVSKKKKLEDGDIITLFTRGVWESIGIPELLDSIEEASAPEDVCTGLEEVILSEQKDIVENYTIATLFIDKVYKNANSKKIKKIILAVSTIVLMLVLTLSIALFMKYRKNKSNINKMIECMNTGVDYVEDENYIRASKEFDKAQTYAEKVSVKKSSKNYSKKVLVDQYQKLSIYVVDAENCFNRSQYDKACKNYELAIETASQINCFSDDNMKYLQDQKDKNLMYLQYQKKMTAGDDSLHADDYDSAIKSFKDAYDLADEIGDSEEKISAETKLNEAQQKKSDIDNMDNVASGDQLVEEGDNALCQSKYELAKKKYQLAIKLYELANADSKVEATKVKMDNISAEQQQATAKEATEEGRNYEKDADQYFDKKNYDKALEYYNLALKAYEKAEKDEKITSTEEKIRETKKAKETEYTVEDADGYVVKAVEKELAGDKGEAKRYYKKALDIYTKLDEDEKISTVKAAIKKLDQNE